MEFILYHQAQIWLYLGDVIKIVDNEGNVIEATGRYYITAETINPYHLVIDIF